MTNCAYELLPVQISPLLIYYGFDLKGKAVERWVEQWMTHYSPYWVRLAVVEAIYQGRYKAISVETILERWSQKGHPILHFNRDFECLVCRNIPDFLPSHAIELLPSKSPLPLLPKATLALTPIAELFPEFEESSEPVSNLSEPSEAIAELALPENPQPLDPQPDNHLDPSESASIPERAAHLLPRFWSAPSGIHRFIPSLDESELYNKLRWVVHQELAQKMGT